MYQPVIGLEIHSELKTKSKMFCSCLNNPDEIKPNTNICPICLGHPGTLPVINKEAVKKVIKTGIALNCRISEYSKFDRKNYFYPDLPKGYQISQYDMPLCGEGFLEIEGKKIRIRRIHLEEDTGRLIHENNYSLVDFNRAGIPLMELVTEPDISSGKEAREFAQELQLILRYLGVSEADMEKGQMRVEVNISLMDLDRNPRVLGTKVEVKNLNSFRAVEKAVEYETKRQEEVLCLGKKVVQETRGWNDIKGITVSQREKEEAHDYRYFPEPDLPPLYNSKEFIGGIKIEIPELPSEKRKRFKKEYNLDKKVIEVFVQNKDLSEYFEKVASEFNPGLKKEDFLKLVKLATNYLVTDLLGLMKGEQFIEEKCKIDPENFAEFISIIKEGKISSKIAKILLEEMFNTGKDPSQIIKDRGLIQLVDEDVLKKVIDEVLKENQLAVDNFKAGKVTAFQFLIGQVMAKTKGRANPKIVSDILKAKLTRG